MLRLNTFKFLVQIFCLGYEYDNREIAVQFPEGAKDFSLKKKRLGQMRPTRSPVYWVPGLFPRKFSGRGRRQNIRIHPDSKLRMSGSRALVPHTSFTVTILLFSSSSFFFMARQPPNGLEPLQCRGFTITFMRFLDHAQRRTTLGRTPLDE